MVIKIKFIHINNSWLLEQGYTPLEEKNIFNEQLDDIMNNTRWYLDNLDYMREYKVSWHNYTKKLKNGKNRATLPKKP